MKLIDILNSPWAIQPEKLLEIQAIYATHLRGEKIDIDAIEARLGRPLSSDQQEYRIAEGGVAVLGIEGVIAPKANLFTRISGGASAQMLQKQVESAAVDPRVKAIVLSIDSPGGSVFGTPELAATIREIAKEKSVVAVSDGLMASAAYWIGSAANHVFMSGPTVHAGSIGVVMTHEYDPSAKTKTTEITAGRYKRIATDTAPLSEEGRAYLQQRVDHIYAVFVDTVAANRGVSAEQVLSDMADGRVFVGQQAIDAGLVDGVATVDQVVEQLAADPQRYSQRARVAARPAARKTAAATAAATEEAAPGAGDEAPQPVTSEGAAMPITRDQLAAEAPELLQAILAEGRTAGAEAERARIQAVEAQSLRGHEALITALKFDGKTTGPEAAVAVLNAEKKARSQAAADLAADAPQPAAPAAAPAVEQSAAAEDASKPLEERAKATWDANASLRNEFAGDFGAYLGYRKAMDSGRLRVLGKRAA